jgi:hypothetical protein
MTGGAIYMKGKDAPAATSAPGILATEAVVAGRVKAWERQPDESPVAHTAFVAYRDLGTARSFAETARRLGKADSLIRRWAERHRWRERTWQWDVTQARSDEATARGERDESIRRQMREADQLQRLAMAKITSLVGRDPESGQLTLDPKVTPKDAVLIYRLGFDVQQALAGTADPGTAPDADSEMQALPTPELHELLRLAKERANTGQEIPDEDKS